MTRVDQRHNAIECLAVLALCFSGPAISQSLICAAEQASGFVYDQQTDAWKVSSMPVEQRQYRVTPANQDDLVARALKYDYEVTDAATSKPVIHCKAIKFEDSNDETGLILCRGAYGAIFNIDRDSGRYVRSQPSGYVTRQASTREEEGPYMEIGNCRQL